MSNEVKTAVACILGAVLAIALVACGHVETRCTGCGAVMSLEDAHVYDGQGHYYGIACAERCGIVGE